MSWRVTPDHVRAKEGDTIHVDVTSTNPEKPDYTVSAFNDYARFIEMEDETTFIMPGGTNVTVYAEFYKKPDTSIPYMYRWWDDENERVLEEVRWQPEDEDVLRMSSVADGGTLEDGKWYYVDKNVTFNQRIHTDGHVRIILGDGATVNFKRGLEVSVYEHLEVFDQSGGTGKLISTSERFVDHSDQGEAAIGADYGIGGNMTFCN